MRAVVATRPGSPDVLEIREIPDPVAVPGTVLIRIRAFGLNRAELFTRQGDSPGVEFPRVLGIECVGEVVDAPGTLLRPGQKVAALMGGMGRIINGGYAEMTVVPETSVLPLETELDWATLGSIPEMYQTARGSLVDGLELASTESLLIRGGTSSVGLMSIAIAKQIGAEVAATTRSEDKRQMLFDHGADHALVDDGNLADQIDSAFPGGANKTLELVGAATLIDSLRCSAKRGTVCFTGIFSGSWTLERFEPLLAIPKTVKLTAYGGEADDLPAAELQRFVNTVEAGTTKLPPIRTFSFEEVAEAHRLMEENNLNGKAVVVVD